MAQAANNVIPFAFEDRLVRAVNKEGAPWFVGKDVCEILHIKDYHQALDRLDDDERGGCTVPTPSGEQIMSIVSEPGVYRLIFTSRRPEAEHFKRWLAHEVLPTIRKTGQYRPADQAAEASDPFALNAESAREIEIKLAMVNTAARIFGHERARAVWKQLGLVAPAEPEEGGKYEAMECLEYLLAAEHEGETVHRLLIRAMEDDAEASEKLKTAGITADPEQDRFSVANRHSELERYFKGTPWDSWQWSYKLRRLPGAEKDKSRKVEKNRVSRGVFIPARYLDARPAGAPI